MKKLKVGRRVILVANKKQGFKEERGTVLGYNPKKKVVTVELDPQFYDESDGGLDDGIRETHPRYVKLEPQNRRRFGRDRLIIGEVYDLHDTVSASNHAIRRLIRVKVRNARVDPYTSAVLVGISFETRNVRGKRDDDGFEIVIGGWCFPHQLRRHKPDHETLIKERLTSGLCECSKCCRLINVKKQGLAGWTYHEGDETSDGEPYVLCPKCTAEQDE